MKKLTVEQQSVLDLLKIGEAKSAYDLQARLVTMRILQKRGFVEGDCSQPGAFSMPKIAVLWKRIK